MKLNIHSFLLQLKVNPSGIPISLVRKGVVSSDSGAMRVFDRNTDFYQGFESHSHQYPFALLQPFFGVSPHGVQLLAFLLDQIS